MHPQQQINMTPGMTPSASMFSPHRLYTTTVLLRSMTGTSVLKKQAASRAAGPRLRLGVFAQLPSSAVAVVVIEGMASG